MFIYSYSVLKIRAMSTYKKYDDTYLILFVHIQEGRLRRGDRLDRKSDDDKDDVKEEETKKKKMGGFKSMSSAAKSAAQK